VHAFDRAQRKHPVLAVPVAVVKKFGDDQGGGLAALVAYYSFFSLFPLLLVFVTVLGYVLQGNSSLQTSIEQSVLGQFPVIGQQIQVHSLEGSGTALVIGLAAALWGGLGVTQAAQRAFDHVWAVPHKQRPDFLHSRLRGIALLIVLGTLFIVSTAASGVVTGGLHGAPLKVAGIVLALLLNLSLFFFAFRLMTSDEIPTKSLLIGVAVAAAVWELLQIVGGYYVDHVYKTSSNTAGDRAADLASPRRADDAVCGRDQRCHRAQAVAADPVRRPHAPRGPGDTARPRQGRGALTGRAGRRAVSAADGDTPVRR
jgi:inner membrane protein YhjD